MIKILFLFLMVVVLGFSSCSKKSELQEVIRKNGTRINFSEPPAGVKKVVFKISPEGFHWGHLELAQIYQGAVYRHNFEGMIHLDNLRNKKSRLEDYIKTLRNIKRTQFNKWERVHQKSFLINAYNAHALLLLLEDGSNIKLFSRKYSFDSFILEEIIAKKRDPLIIFALKHFSKRGPELFNAIYNYLNLKGNLKVVSNSFFRDESKNFVKDGVLHLSPIIKKYRKLFPAEDKEFRNFIAPFLDDKTRKKIATLKIAFD